MSNIKDCLLDSLDCILGIREDMGAQIDDVYLVTRTWAGERVGDGKYKDVTVKMKNTPEIVDHSHSIRMSEGGSIKQGDLVLKTISQKDYSEDQLRTDTGLEKVEKFVKVGDHYYRTINVRKRLVTWDVHIRKVSEDEAERR